MSSTTDDYKERPVDWSDPIVNEEGENLHIYVVLEIHDEYLEQLIISGKAESVVLVSCPRTAYRVLFRDLDAIIIPKGMFAGEVHIEPAIVACEDIADYSDPYLSDDYEGISILIPKHGFIEYEYYTFKIERKSMPTLKSVCHFVASDDGHIKYTTEGNTIDISLPEDLWLDYSTLDVPEQEIFTAMHFPPILVDLLYKYWYSGDVAAQFPWANAIQQCIDDLYPGVDFSKKDANTVSPYELAMQIIESLSCKASRRLVSNIKESD
ncbi:hypothetical protein AR505_0335 [methanogenic archaeon ISO4-H5]|nr:hypothetical protein AR505_0335 [methanogenic archaeon ISO4-H5]